MARGHPPFLLAGGEIVLLILAFRIALWVVRGWRQMAAQGPPDPDDPGGLPVPVTIASAAARPPAPELPAEEFRQAA